MFCLAKNQYAEEDMKICMCAVFFVLKVTSALNASEQVCVGRRGLWGYYKEQTDLKSKHKQQRQMSKGGFRVRVNTFFMHL